MVKNLQYTLFILVFTALTAMAQLSVVEDQTFIIEGAPNDQLIIGKMQVQMGSDQAGYFYWELDPADDIPEEWVFSVCVGEFCYIDNLHNAPAADSILLGTEEIEDFYVYLKPNGVDGLSSCNLKLTSTDGIVTHVSQDFGWDISAVSSTETLLNDEDLVLFPNPTSDYFSINNDKNVSKVTVYTILGKEMFSYNHEPGQAYSVSELRDGFYLASLIDDDGKSIKVIRFSKTNKI